VQWEFPGPAGPPPGRYVVRRFAGDDVREVVVVGDGSAPRRRIRRRERPEAVAVTRVTVIDASPAGDPEDPAWLQRARATLSSFLSAWRVASASAGAPDPSRASVMRIGVGTGDQVAAGGWHEARTIPAPELAPERRRAKHRPAERLAALMAARDAALACEELTLRARADLDAHRPREAALQLEAALLAALAELAGWRGVGDMSARLDELATHRDGVAAAAQAAREGRLDGAALESVSAALARLEAALRARAVHAAE
jgi:hypothetical protein